MSKIRVLKAATFRISEIYRHSRAQWGDEQARSYVSGLFAAFEAIEANAVRSRVIPAAYGITGYFFRYQHHFVYWRHLATGEVAIVTILHERMHQAKRLRDDFEP